MNIAVIGAGAVGVFAAIQAKTNFPDSRVIIFEKTSKVLSKVKISGGGRCNVTNGCTSVKSLVAGYPRGSKMLKKLFKEFNNTHTQTWFESRGVALKTEKDNRVFPISDDSQTIIECLLSEVKKLNIELRLSRNVQNLVPHGGKIQLHFTKEVLSFDKVIVATGGSPKRIGLEWLAMLGHSIETPVPSLFTFNMPDEKIVSLMGVVAENVRVTVPSSSFHSDGPLLITHWGMSGPAILKLSALAARYLAAQQYSYILAVNWINTTNQEAVNNHLNSLAADNPKKLVSNSRPYGLPERLWLFLLQKSHVPKSKKWEDLGKKAINKLTHILTNDTYTVRGKTTFKEEFVTCGGIALESINKKSLESLHCKNLYFAGEILDIDGITGGYNFQAAWTTGFIAGKLD